MLVIKKCDCQKDFYSTSLLRTRVFVIEQNVSPLEELDEFDCVANQYIVYEDDKVVGCCRALVSEDKAKLGRFCVDKEYRKHKIGSKLIKFVENDLKENHPNVEYIYLGAQIHALNFYKSNGYQEYGEEFLDANIPHLHMKKTIK